MMTDAQVKGNADAVMSYMHEFYLSRGDDLNPYHRRENAGSEIKGTHTDALKGLMKLAPKTAVIEKDGVETTVPIAQVKKGDIFVVRPGENIPVDGIVLEGNSAVNESALTGRAFRWIRRQVILSRLRH